MNTSRLTCRELVELVTDYFEGALLPHERVRFERHIDGCPNCRAYLDQLGKTRQLVGRLTENAVAGDARERLLGAFRGWKRQ